jgi:hypothetical protein
MQQRPPTTDHPASTFQQSNITQRISTSHRRSPEDGLEARYLYSSQSTCLNIRFVDMAWRSSGATNAALVENMARNGLITSSRVKQAMLRVCS